MPERDAAVRGVAGEVGVVVDLVPGDVERHRRRDPGEPVDLRRVGDLLVRIARDALLGEDLEPGPRVAEGPRGQLDPLRRRAATTAARWSRLPPSPVGRCRVRVRLDRMACGAGSIRPAAAGGAGGGDAADAADGSAPSDRCRVAATGAASLPQVSIDFNCLLDIAFGSAYCAPETNRNPARRAGRRRRSGRDRPSRRPRRRLRPRAAGAHRPDRRRARARPGDATSPPSSACRPSRSARTSLSSRPSGALVRTHGGAIAPTAAARSSRSTSASGSSRTRRRASGRPPRRWSTTARASSWTRAPPPCPSPATSGRGAAGAS